MDGCNSYNTFFFRKNILFSCPLNNFTIFFRCVITIIPKSKNPKTITNVFSGPKVFNNNKIGKDKEAIIAPNET